MSNNFRWYSEHCKCYAMEVLGSFVKLILAISDVILNGIISLIPFSDFSMRVYENTWVFLC